MQWEDIIRVILSYWPKLVLYSLIFLPFFFHGFSHNLVFRHYEDTHYIFLIYMGKFRRITSHYFIIPLPTIFFKQTDESGLNASFRFHPFFINRGFIFYNSYILQTTTSKKFFRHPTTNSVIAFCMLIHRYPTKRISLDWAEPTNLSLISLLVGHTKNQSSRASNWILLIKSFSLLTFD